jgi:hypothetical protein
MDRFASQTHVRNLVRCRLFHAPEFIKTQDIKTQEKSFRKTELKSSCRFREDVSMQFHGDDDDDDDDYDSYKSKLKNP